MNVLQLCHKSPFPRIDGGSIAVNELTHLLIQSGLNVQIVTFDTKKHAFSKKAAAEFPSVKILAIPIQTEFGFIEAAFGILSAGKVPFSLKRVYSKSVENHLYKILNEIDFDIVIFDGLQFLIYLDFIKEKFSGKLVYRAHNIEFQISLAQANSESNIFKRFFIHKNARTLEKFEKSALNKVDKIWSISPVDKAVFNEICNTETCVLPLTFQKPDISELPENSEAKITLGFIGALDWEPNIVALKWFLEHVWGKVNAKNVHLKIAGKSGSNHWKAYENSRTTFLGEVDDAKAFMLSCQILIVPLFVGSGIRVKILEAMSLGVAVFCSPKAAEGIQIKGDELAILKDEKAWINAIESIVEHKKLLKEMTEKASEYFNANHNRDTFSRNFNAKYLQV